MGLRALANECHEIGVFETLQFTTVKASTSSIQGLLSLCHIM